MTNKIGHLEETVKELRTRYTDSFAKLLEKNHPEVGQYLQFIHARKKPKEEYPVARLSFCPGFALEGQSLNELVSGPYGLPCWRTIQRTPKAFFEQAGLTAAVFYGRATNILNLSRMSGVPAQGTHLRVDR
jgi:hypothetical protein